MDNEYDPHGFDRTVDRMVTRARRAFDSQEDGGGEFKTTGVDISPLEVVVRFSGYEASDDNRLYRGECRLEVMTGVWTMSWEPDIG